MATLLSHLLEQVIGNGLDALPKTEIPHCDACGRPFPGYPGSEGVPYASGEFRLHNHCNTCGQQLYPGEPNPPKQ